MKTKQLKIANNFYLIEKELKEETNQELIEVKKQVPVNHIVNIDVSGSMYSDLSEIRKQLKNKLPNLVKESDTITIIWFSGLNESGILKEEVEVKSLTSLKELNEAIDKFLKPIGLTSFSKPLDLTKEVIERIKKNRPNSVFNLLFMTDGCHNSGSFNTVIDSLKNLSSDLASATFVEYGLYADSKRLSDMCEIVGGEKILASTFDEYDVIFEEKISKSLSSSKKVIIELNKDYKYNFVFSVNEFDEINVYSINNENNQILVPENLQKVYYFSENSNNKYLDITEKEFDLKIKYASLFVLTDKTLNQDAELLFSIIGDVNLFDLFNSSYGKQKLNSFKSLVKECVTDVTKRHTKGYSANLTVDENCFNVIELFDILSSDYKNVFYPNSPNFNYKRIGTKKVLAGTKISDEFKEKISECKTIEELKELINNSSIETKKELEFKNYDNEKGYSLSELVWNESRANLSVRIKYDGYVILPENEFNIEKVDTFIYRTYTIIKDGILNLTQLPVSLTDETYKKLINFVKTNDKISLERITKKEDVNGDETYVYLIDFSKLPIINRSMTKSVSAQKLAELEWNLLKLQGDKKGYDYYDKLLFPRVSEEFVSKYSKEAEEWLKELGVTQFNGFSPKLTSAESTDFYLAIELNTKIAGYSSIPKVQDVETKINDNKPLKAADYLLYNSVTDYLKQIDSDLYKTQDEATQKLILEKWLKKSKQIVIDEKRRIMNEIVKIKFGLILSRGWFTEFSSFDENILETEIDGQKLKVTFDLKDIEVKI